MGSIGFTRDRALTPAQEVRKYLEDHLYDGHQVVAAADRSTGDYPHGEWHKVLYAAVDDGAGNVTAHVLLYTAKAGELYIKSLHEDMGTDHRDVPAKLLAALTPTENRTAQQWREKATEWRINDRAGRKKARAAVGHTITLAHSLTYTEPVGEVARVRVESLTRWIDPATGYRLRPPRGWHHWDFTTTGQEAA